MNPIYTLESHLKYPHLKFALVHGIHYQDFPTHQHDFSELFIVVSGTGTHTVSGYRYPLSAGDVFVINGRVEHGFSDVNELILVNLMFDSGSPLFETPSLKLLPGYQALFNIEPLARQKSEYTARLNLDQEQFSQIETILNVMDNEYKNAPPGYAPMLVAMLQQLVITLSRFYHGEDVQMSSSTMILSRALVYMEENFQQDDIKTEQVASASFVSTRQLERLFRQYLQTSPSQYLKAKRLEFAKERLSMHPECSIQHIADESGFSDSNYFSKCFKQKYNVSPREFRKKAR